MKMKKYLAVACSMVLAASLLLSGCGGAENGDASGSSAVASGSESVQPAEPTAPEKSAMELEAEKMVGEWQLAYVESTFADYGVEEPTSYYNFADEADGDVRSLEVYMEDGVLRMDDYSPSWEYSSSYGMKLVPESGSLYDGCPNSSWKCNLKFGHQETETKNAVALVEDNKLQYYAFTDYPDYAYSYTTVSTFLRVGSPENDNREEYRYQETVTVSNADEFVKALGSNKKILMKEGVYNLSEVDYSMLVEYGYDEEYYEEYNPFSYLNNVYISAENGSDVEICIEEYWDDVLPFQYCSNLTLVGLTIGHHVEPGTCDGNVIELTGCNNVTIDNCNLYGSGAYGLAAYDSYHISVSNSDIYECTYGLLDMYSTGYVAFNDCTFRDTEGYSLLGMRGCYCVYFTNCTFKNNEAANGYEFLSWPESMDVCFDKCLFENNTYDSFSESEPAITNSTFK